MGTWYAIEWSFLQRLTRGIRSSVGILALPFRTLYNNMSLLSLLHFLRDSHFKCSRMPIMLPVSKLKFPVTNLATRFWIFSISFWRPTPKGSQTEPLYSRTGRTSPLYAASFTSCGQEWIFCLRKPRVWLALVQILLTCIPSQIYHLW